MYSLAVPLTAPPSAISSAWYSPFSGTTMSVQGWMNSFQSQKVEERSMIMPIGYRTVRETDSRSVLEDSALNESSATEGEISFTESYNEVDMSTTSSVRTPVPTSRVMAQELDEDGLGLDDDEPNYYDSDTSM